MKFSVKDFVFFKRPEWSFGIFSPIYIKEMWEIINSVFLKKFHSLPEDNEMIFFQNILEKLIGNQYKFVMCSQIEISL